MWQRKMGKWVGVVWKMEVSNKPSRASSHIGRGYNSATKSCELAPKSDRPYHPKYFLIYIYIYVNKFNPFYVPFHPSTVRLLQGWINFGKCSGGISQSLKFLGELDN